MCQRSVRNDGKSLKYIPKNRISKELIDIAISNQPLALEFVPDSKKTEVICVKALKKNPLSIRFVPEMNLSQELCDEAFEMDWQVFHFIPDAYKTLEMCLKVIKRADKLKFNDFPEELRNDVRILDALIQKYEIKVILDWNNNIIEKIERDKDYFTKPETLNPLKKETLEYLEIKQRERKTSHLPASRLGSRMTNVHNADSNSLMLPLGKISSNSMPVVYNDDMNVVHDLAAEEKSSRTIYYITDIHLEHQVLMNLWADLLKKYQVDDFDNADVSVQETIEMEYLNNSIGVINEKVSEMVSTASDREGILLIGGDVADSIKLSSAFYKRLFSIWRGTMISILGNHELWDGTTIIDWQNPNYVARPIGEIIADYSEQINHSEFMEAESILLENAMYIEYKNSTSCVIKEEQILNASDEDLADICSKASFILLGGIGYSGLHPHFNAELGLYRKAITTLEEDKSRAECFRIVYEKLNRSAGNRKVIVITHTQVEDWTTEPCNPNWIYINGHTHRNSITREKDGTTVLADNQLGYEPKKWKLNAFTVSGWYDPLESYEDGIHKISSELYKEFNIGRGIGSKGCNYKGDLYALKRNGLYMFVLQTQTSLCLMVGGTRKRLEQYDVQYYYDNMALYGHKVKEVIKPYQQVLESVSDEVKSIGGTGTIHGCIVDVSFLSHIYINPFDGKITPYFAWDITSRQSYENIQDLLEANEPELLEIFKIEQKKKALPIMNKYMTKKANKAGDAVIPQWMFGTEMYEPSRIMKSVQYVWEQNVIRIWNESVLCSNSTLMESKKSIEDKK